mmetsp:Transcript_6940/g.14453  ORF Transcript_6940/g.14453 Transcript_6940/m.14453 type:complete len:200 (+) Transcript_6940:316-915(+)
MRQEQSYPIVRNVLIRLRFADLHLVVRSLGYGARGEEARDGVASAGCNLLHFVHVLPPRRENDAGAALWVEGGELATRPAHLVFEGVVIFFLVVVLVHIQDGTIIKKGTIKNLPVTKSLKKIVVQFIVLAFLIFNRLPARLRWVVEDKIAAFKVFTLRTQIEYARIMIAIMSRFVGVKNDKITLPAPTALLGGARDVFS